MSVMEQIELGKQVLIEAEVSQEIQRRAVRIIHPKVSDPAQQDYVAATWAYMWAETEEPLTLENVAKQFADKHGAFPWGGPIGNGVSPANPCFPGPPMFHRSTYGKSRGRADVVNPALPSRRSRSGPAEAGGAREMRRICQTPVPGALRPAAALCRDPIAVPDSSVGRASDC